MAQPLSFRWDEDFIARIDKARGDIPRSRFVRRAVEQWLLRTYVEDDPDTVGIDRAKLASAGRRIAAQPSQTVERSIEKRGGYTPTAQGSPPIVPPPKPSDARRSAVPTSSQSKRDVRPIPKGGK